MKRDYTGKYTVGQTVYINDKRSRLHGKQFTIETIDINPKKAYAYRVDGLWYPESELSAESPFEAQPAPAAAPPTNDLMGQLNQLAQLHTAGVLSDAEFAAAKQKLLA